MKKRHRKVIAILTSILILVGSKTSFASSSPSDESIIELFTTEDLLQFATDCTLDRYSENKKVVLMNDIDLTGYEFEGIPIFLGEFEGNGHTIKGLNLTQKRDYQGLFRYLGEDAQVSNLSVEGRIDSESHYLGGIAGENLGTIHNSTFTGSINGLTHLGGIAGENLGAISNSTAHGTVLGQAQVGGLVGDNSGRVIRSENHANVNTILVMPDQALDNPNLSTMTQGVITSDIVDIGGVIGLNTGVVLNATNFATIGYPHVGYNVGGVIGRQSGYVSDSKNHGHVQGRKEVGGVVGQIEPYVSSVFSPSKLQQLQTELNILSDLTSTFMDTGQSMNQAVSTSVSHLNQAVDTSRVHTDVLLDEVQDIINKNVETVNTISITLAEVTDDLVPILETLVQISTDMEAVATQINGLTSHLKTLSSYLEQTEDVASHVSEHLKEAIDQFNQAQDIIASTKTQIEKLMKLILDESVTEEEVKPLLEEIEVQINQARIALEASTASLAKAIEALEQLPSSDAVQADIAAFIQDIEDASLELQKLTEQLTNVLELTTQLVKGLSESEIPSFVGSTKPYELAKDNLSDSLGVVSDQIENLNQTFSTHANQVFEELDVINKQFTVVLNLMIEIMEDMMFASGEGLFKVTDISYENIGDLTNGKVISATNTGLVEGDINVGGIAGAISFEYSFDREDDYKAGNPDRQIEERRGVAVIESGMNQGDVTSKKDGAGGIVGFMDFGFVTDSTSMAHITSTSGDYVGGIAGHSQAKISSSYAKNTLSGKSYVGGIVGYGHLIDQNYSISDVMATQGFAGSIAGAVSENSVVEQNYFVGDTLGGINEISYGEKAEPITFNELKKVKNLPDEFEMMQVEFYVDDKLAEVIEVAYNEPLLADAMPIVPEKEGWFGYWENVDLNHVTTNKRVHVIYEPQITTLGSDTSIEHLSQVLVDGTFTKEDQLTLIENEEKVISYTISLSNPEALIEKVRYLMPDKKVNIQILENNSWVDVDSQQDGKYIVFSPVTAANTLTFRMSEAHPHGALIGAITGIVIGAVSLGIYKIRKKKQSST